MHKLELKQWHIKLNEAASKRDWRAYRAQKQFARTREWEHYLNWQTALKQHFEDIFHKEDPASVASRMQHMRDELTYLCKTHAWHPFQLAELKVTQGRWPRRKSSGTRRHHPSSAFSPCWTTNGRTGSCTSSTTPFTGAHHQNHLKKE